MKTAIYNSDLKKLYFKIQPANTASNIAIKAMKKHSIKKVYKNPYI